MWGLEDATIPGNVTQHWGARGSVTPPARCWHFGVPALCSVPTWGVFKGALAIVTLWNVVQWCKIVRIRMVMGWAPHALLCSGELWVGGGTCKPAASLTREGGFTHLWELVTHQGGSRGKLISYPNTFLFSTSLLHSLKTINHLFEMYLRRRIISPAFPLNAL